MLLLLQLGPVADAVFGSGATLGGGGEAAQLQRQLRLLSVVNIVPASPYRVANTAGMRAPPTAPTQGLWLSLNPELLIPGNASEP